MKKPSLGCITPLGIATFTIVLLAVAGVTLGRGGMLFSSGPLNAQAGAPLGEVASHAEIGGKCGSCHAAPWSKDTMADRCLACHTAVSAEMADPGRLHGILKASYPEMDCRTCHTEHNGPDAPLTFLELTTFPHDLVGFSLAAHSAFSEGKPVACRDCHTEKLTVLDPQVCAACHVSLSPQIEKEHYRVFGLDCLACHDGIDTYGKNFDHASTGFALVGAHAQTACQDCHPGAISLEMLSSAPHDCVTCHQQDDAHRGNLGRDCGACHTPVRWPETTFEHSITGYELVGKHRQVECSACHPGQVYAGTAKTCEGCHATDNPHEERYGTDCGRCHTPAAWQDVQFDHTVFDTTDCLSCHQQDAPEGHYPGQCSSCHTTDGWLPAFFDHAAAGATDCQACHTRPQGHYPGQCSACHTTAAWLPAFFDHTAAGATDCQACHTRPANHFGGQCSLCHSTTSWAFVHSNGTDCQGCHTRPAGHYAGQCSACHSISAWRPASFNHSAAGAVNCQGCHAPPGNHYAGQCSSCHSTSSWAFVHASGTDCQACHSRPSGHPDGQCSNCHNTSNWENEGSGGNDDD